VVVDIEAVTGIIEEAAQTLVLPRFARLEAGEIEAKSTPGDAEDIVTIVDREVEAHLSRALRALDPSAAVLGEEAAHQQPELLRLLDTDQPLWVIDPIDGTRNFAAGDSGFGIMVAYVVSGATRLAWIVLPARRQTFVAEVGSGATLNGSRIRVGPASVRGAVRGAVLVRYMPEMLREAVSGALAERVVIKRPAGCAAIEYTDVLGGRSDFVVYYRLLPWDHAAPSLILIEAGGQVSHLNGKEYTARSQSQVTFVVRNAEVSDQLRAWVRSRVQGSY
jgi:fructose-1,6-bisphosphatase/inositol monophosphatase family enzyme